MSDKQSTTRFSDRVADYVRARPGYPAAVVDALRERTGLTGAAAVADVGAGTGISTKWLIDAGFEVTAVEPNEAMRTAIFATVGPVDRLNVVNGTAEATTLPDASVQLVVAAQAFHWFDRLAFRKECERILRPGGSVALLWNDRQLGGTPFLDRYEALLQQFGTDYVNVNHRNLSEAQLAAFFAPGVMQTFRCPSAQQFDFEGLKARLLSSSYAPNLGSPGSDAMLVELRRAFDACQQNGQVEMLYETLFFCGRLV
jgi:SAM-dependent methyltransferase